MEKVIKEVLQFLDLLIYNKKDNCVNDLNMHALKTKFPEIDIAFGSCRWVLIFDDFVLKFPRYGRVWNDFSEEEEIKYKNAQACHIEEILVPIEKIAILGEAGYELPVYKQPKIQFTYSMLSEEQILHFNTKMSKTEYADAAWEMLEEMYEGEDMEISWMAKALEIYGAKMMWDFVQWTHDNYVNDLHDENYGFYQDRPVLLDYAGF